MTRKKILFFAPFGSWTVHHQVDAVAGAALKLRGCEVHALGCDGIFEYCLLAGYPPNKNKCRNCTMSGVNLFSKFGIPMTHLSSLINQTDSQQCFQWVDSLSSDQYRSAEFEGGQIGKWVFQGMQGHLHSYELDYSKEKVVTLHKSLLYNGAILQRAFLKFIDQYAPDFIFPYSGAHPYYRVAYELSRRQGIPVLTHERGDIDDSFRLVSNEHMRLESSRVKHWENWKGLPLSTDELSICKNYYNDREQGKNWNCKPVISQITSENTVRKVLRIPHDTPIITFFTSSNWEIGAGKEVWPSCFESQVESIKKTAKMLASKDVCLVIRHHPNMVRKTHADLDFISELQKLNRQLPENVRVLMPNERLTSYSIIWNADAVISFGSSTGLESIARGCASVSNMNKLFSLVSNVDCIGDMNVNESDFIQTYEKIIENAIRRTQNFNVDELRHLYRSIYYLYFRLNYKFKSFGIKNMCQSDIRIKSIEELREGNDPALDKVCNHVMYGEELYPVPSEQDRQRSPEEETALLEKEVAKIRARRQKVREYNMQNGEFNEPMVTVVRMRQDGVSRPGETVLAQTIKRSRHKNIEQIEMAAPPSFDETNFLQELEAAANNAKGDYVYFGTDNTHIDESLFSTSVDFLQEPENANYDGIVSGAWICDKKGAITGEIFTERKETESYAEMVGISPSMKTPEQFLSLFVWRKQALHELVSNLMDRDVAYNDISSVIYEMTLSDRTRFNLKKSLIPNIASYMPLTAADLVEKGISLVSEGNCQGASELFDKAKQLSPCIKEIEYCRAMTKMFMGELWQAKIIAESAIEQAGPYDQTEKLLQMLSQKLCDKDLCYEDVALGVETVESALVPGQEKFLFDKVKSLPDGAKILEIGAYKGRSTVSMAFACVGTNKRVISIDTFTGMTNGGTKSHGNTFFDIWYSNVIRLGLAKYVTAMPGLSHERLLQLEQSHKFDFVFIDASHHYVDVLKDLELSYPLVKDGGWMAFHDVEPGWPGPWRLWRESTMQLLSSHQYLSTIACGRKEPGRIFTKPPAQDNFPYSRQWAEYLKTSDPQLSRAMFISLEHGMTSKGHEMLSIAERIIASMPEYLKKYLRGMFNLEAHIDPYLHYWNALTFEHESNIEHAISCLNKAIDNAPLPFHQSLKNRIRKLSESEKPILQTTLGYESMK